MSRSRKPLTEEECQDLFGRNPKAFMKFALAGLIEMLQNFLEERKPIERPAEIPKPKKRGVPRRKIDEDALGVYFLEFIESERCKTASQAFDKTGEHFEISWMTAQTRLFEEGLAWRAYLERPGKDCRSLYRWLRDREKNTLLPKKEWAIEAARLYKNGLGAEVIVGMLPREAGTVDPLHVKQIGEVAKRGLLPALLAAARVAQAKQDEARG